MKPIETMTLDEIRKMFKEILNLKVSRAALYNYIRDKGFPPSMGLGSPRKWRKVEVYTWFESQRLPPKS